MNKIIVSILGIPLLIISLINFSLISDSSVKEYVILNFDKFEKSEHGYRYKTDDLFYYEEITFRKTSENTYQIILWGNRNSLLWNFKRDKQIIVDVLYSRYYDTIEVEDICLMLLLEKGKI